MEQIDKKMELQETRAVSIVKYNLKLFCHAHTFEGSS